jgi:hypothetical protein
MLQGGEVFIAPPGTHPSAAGGWTHLGEAVDLQATYDSYQGPRFTVTAVQPPRWRMESIQEQADRLTAERLATEEPGAAGW